MRDRSEDTDAQRRRHAKTEAETGRSWSQVREHLEPPDAGRVQEGLTPQDQGDTGLTTP